MLELSQERVESTAGLASEPHQLKSVAWPLGVFEEDLDDGRHLGREFEVFGRLLHGTQCSAPYIGGT